MARDVNSIEHFRDYAGLTQKELGDLVGVTRQTIAAWEKGERDVSVAQLAKVGRALGVSLELLLGLSAEHTANLLFRADDPRILSPEVRQQLGGQAEDYAAMERFAGETAVLPPSRPLEEYDRRVVESVARETRDWLGVEEAPLGDVLALLERKGLKILAHALPNPISGFSAFTEAFGAIIVVNSRHALERQYFTCLHEIGHLTFHRREYDHPHDRAKRGDPREKAANHFASAVLLPRDVVEYELHGWTRGWIPEPVLVDLKLRYGVSMRTVLLRAAELELISKAQAGKQIGVLNKRFGKEHEYPELPVPDEESRPVSRLERLTYRALVNERITASRAAEVLGKPLMEVRQKLQSYLNKSFGGASA